MDFKLRYIFLLVFFAGLQAVAQKKDENIGTEVVNVVKPYTPTISDAFKVKETPPLEDEDNTKKANIEYNIFSFPVASTFAPAKGRAASVDKTEQERIYKNFATVGIGNYGTAQAELFVTENVGESGYVGGMFRHVSSSGGIEDVELDDSFNNSSLDLTYGNKQSTFNFNIDAGYQNQGYNWYGLPEGFGNLMTESERDELVNSIQPDHMYHNAYIGGKLGFNESFFDELSVKFNRFWDSYDSQENRFVAKPEFGFEVASTKINAKMVVDYLGGTFENDGFGDQRRYGFTNFGFHPSFNIVRNAWSINLGAAAFYSLDNENADNKFFIYPQVNASLKVVGDLMIFYTGAEGTLEQNSYRDFTNENPYLSPDLIIAPTDRQFDIFAGLKGKLANSISYNIRGSYINEQNRALFKSNDYDEDFDNAEYGYGNSLAVVYDNMNTLSFFGELKADFSKNVSFGVNATFNTYDTEFEREAWNLPTLRASTSLDVNITKKWYAGASVFYVGERNDAQLNVDFPVNEAEGLETLEAYIDANLHVGFKYNDRLTAFVRLNNVANQMYEKWLNYPVQGFQAVLGASYKFDF